MITAIKNFFFNRAKPEEPGKMVGFSQARLVAVANQWRETYNPLRGLTMARLSGMLDMVPRGYLTEIQWLYYHILRRSPILGAIRKRRSSALLKLDWNIKVVSELPPGTTEAQAEAQRTVLRAAYEVIDNLKDAINFLALAEFTGFSILQKHRATDLDVVHLEPLDHWNWLRDGLHGEWLWNAAAENLAPETVKGRPESRIDQADFLIRECECPILEASAAPYIRMSLALKDWTAFSEIYGIPAAFITGPHPKDWVLTQDQQDSYAEKAQEVAQGAGGYLPGGCTVSFPTEVRGQNPFKEFLDDIRSEIVLAGTGGKLTMLNEATGLGSGNSESHQDTFDDIAQAEASKISEVFQQQFDRDVLGRHFSGQPPLAYFALEARKEEDVSEVVDQIAKLSQAGYQMAPEEVSEKTGFEVELKPQPSISLMGASGDRQGNEDDDDGDKEKSANRRRRVKWIFNRDSAEAGTEKLMDAVLEDLTGVESKWLAAVKPQFQKLIADAMNGAITDTAFADALTRANERIPELFGQLDANAVRTALEKAMGAAVVNGAIAMEEKR